MNYVTFNINCPSKGTLARNRYIIRVNFNFLLEYIVKQKISESFEKGKKLTDKKLKETEKLPVRHNSINFDSFFLKKKRSKRSQLILF